MIMMIGDGDGDRNRVSNDDCDDDGNEHCGVVPSMAPPPPKGVQRKGGRERKRDDKRLTD